MNVRNLTASFCAVVFALSLFAGVALAQGYVPADNLTLGDAIVGESPEESSGMGRFVVGASTSPHTPVSITNDNYVNSRAQVVLASGRADNDFTGAAKSEEAVRARLNSLLSNYDGSQSSARAAFSGTNPLGLKMQATNPDGSLTEASKEQLLDTINFFRFCAGSGDLTLDTNNKEAAAQAGSDFLSKNNVIGGSLNPHYSADASGDVMAISGLHTSNIAAAKTTGSTLYDYNKLLENLFHDDDATSNFKAMGHRRWLLNNGLSSIGIGYTGPQNGNQYTHLLTYIDGNFGGNGGIEAFPANGAFPVELMNFHGWTISMGRNERFDFSNVTMKVKATFPGDSQPTEVYLRRVQDPNEAFTGNEKNWFGLASGNCGAGQTLIFEPSFIYKDANFRNAASLIGTELEIEIDGIVWDYGSWGTSDTTKYPVAPIKYKTSFFSAFDAKREDWTPGAAPTYTPEPTPTPSAAVPSPELFVSPLNPQKGKDATIYCTNYDQLGIKATSSTSTNVALYWQYEDQSGNFNGLMTSGKDTACFTLDPATISGLDSLSSLDIYATVAKGNYISYLGPESSQNKPNVLSTTTKSIKLDGSNKAEDNQIFDAPIVTASAAEPAVGSAVTFTAKPANVGLWANQNLEVRWKINDADATGVLADSRDEATYEHTASVPGSLTAKAALYLGDIQVSPYGQCTVDVQQKEAPTLTSERAENGSVTVKAQPEASYLWKKNGVIVSDATGPSLSVDLSKDAASDSEWVTVECAEQKDGQPVSAAGRITILPYDPTMDDVVFEKTASDPTLEFPRAGEPFAITVKRASGTDGRQARSDLESEDSDAVEWIVLRNNDRLQQDKDYTIDGASLRIDKVSGSNYTVIAKYQDTNACAWDFAPVLAEAPAIQILGTPIVGSPLNLAIDTTYAVEWSIGGVKQQSEGTVISYEPHSTNPTTVEATLILDGEPVSRTARTEFRAERLGTDQNPATEGSRPTATPTPTESESTESPDQPSESPDKPSESPDQPSESPDKPSDSPDKPSESPDKPSESPDQPSESPDKPSESPDKPSDSPDKPSDSPDKPSDSPDKPSDSPDKPSDSPDKPSDSPDKPSDSPDKPSDSPDKPSDGPSATASRNPDSSASSRPWASASNSTTNSPAGTTGPTPYPTYLPTYGPPGLSSTPSPGASASASASTGSTDSAQPSGSTTAAPGKPSQTAPQPVEIVDGPDGSGPLLIGMTTEAPAGENLVGSLASWVNVPQGGSCTVTAADGSKLDEWSPFATGQLATVRSRTGAVIAEFTIVVKGDVTGNGSLNGSQLVRLAQAVAGDQPLSGAFHAAGDLNNNGRLEIADVMRMARTLSER